MRPPALTTSRLVLLLGLSALACNDPTDLCAPTEGRLDFFSRGDCVFTRASFFAGHEWLTHFANLRAPGDAIALAGANHNAGFCAALDAAAGDFIFAPIEIEAIREGNRRVDYPQELLVHLNASVPDYVEALTDYHDRPENQILHFLLSDRDTHVQAAAASHESMKARTRQALALYTSNRIRALTLIGQVAHTVQDSFSPAHAVRERPAAFTCIHKLKAFLRRAPGFLTPDIEFHGGGEDTAVGHTTTEDSIYRLGRECHDPGNTVSVCGCLSEAAVAAVVATRDYLETVADLARAGAPAAAVDAAMDGFLARQFSACPGSPLDPASAGGAGVPPDVGADGGAPVDSGAQMAVTRAIGNATINQ